MEDFVHFCVLYKFCIYFLYIYFNIYLSIIIYIIYIWYVIYIIYFQSSGQYSTLVPLNVLSWLTWKNDPNLEHVLYKNMKMKKYKM